MPCKILLDAITGESIQTSCVHPPRSQPPDRSRERRADPGAAGSAGCIGAGDRRAEGEAGRAAKDPGQFEPAAVEGAEGQPRGQAAGQRTAPGQPRAPRRRAAVEPHAGRDGHRQAQFLHALPHAVCRQRSRAAWPLRQGGHSAGPPGGDPGGTLCRAVPLLRRHHPGPGARGAGARLAVQPEHHGTGDLPALHPRDQLPAADPAVPEPVRAGDQRGGTGRDVPPRRALLRQRGRGHSDPPAPRAGGLLGRDHGAR